MKKGNFTQGARATRREVIKIGGMGLLAAAFPRFALAQDKS